MQGWANCTPLSGSYLWVLYLLLISKVVILFHCWFPFKHGLRIYWRGKKASRYWSVHSHRFCCLIIHQEEPRCGLITCMCLPISWLLYSKRTFSSFMFVCGTVIAKGRRGKANCLSWHGHQSLRIIFLLACNSCLPACFVCLLWLALDLISLRISVSLESKTEWTRVWSSSNQLSVTGSKAGSLEPSMVAHHALYTTHPGAATLP